MAAILSSTPENWTTLLTDLTPVAEETVGARMEETNLNGQDFSPVPAEITQIIQLAQVGWGAQLGAGRRIGYWAAAALLRDMLTAHVNTGCPTRG